MTTKRPRLVKENMLPLGIPLWLLGCVRMHADGDGQGLVFRWYHPLTWVTLIALLLPCALMGEKLLDAVPLKLSPFWKANREQLQWVTPWTRMDSIKLFDPRLNKAKLLYDTDGA